ncbi:Peroxidase 66 [Striga hermonthica]|uniref:Peroxidase n=1 Tax=Striga hermonthica TaxID=68872 RepID=A0A9N7R018_STRHE|nr:Peroxidase 66 [Striga hermonthica]
MASGHGYLNPAALIAHQSLAAINDSGVPASLMRMHFHDCFVRGCDASVLLDSTDDNKAEKDAAANMNSLRRFDVIDDIKAELEKYCPGIVSCADILAFAARDSFEIAGNLGLLGGYDVPSGRLDGTVSLDTEAQKNLPAPTFNLDQLTKSFASKGLSQRDMVTLSGAHTIGRSHCSSFNKRLYGSSKRLYGFIKSKNSKTKPDTSMDSDYADELRHKCPNPNSNSKQNNPLVPMDPNTPNYFDNSYYNNVINKRGLFTSDQALLTSQRTSDQVNQYASDLEMFLKDFGAAMVKMGNIRPDPNHDGEVRINCRVVNMS